MRVSYVMRFLGRLTLRVIFIGEEDIISLMTKRK